MLNGKQTNLKEEKKNR